MSTPSYIDFRSDTVTHPTPEMRQAMAEAPVGDDVYGDDPTVLALQALGANLLNKEAALFVPSGTMGNLLAAMVHCSHRGSEMIVGKESHMHYYEQGNSATLAGIHSRTVRNLPDGSMPLDEIEALIRPLGDDHFPVTKLICLENTQNRCGGVCLSPEYIDSVGVLAQKHKLALHMDGARLFNAAIGSGHSAARLVAACDSISFCLSKALAAPVGSLLVGSAAFILQAKKYRKALGGGMRQAGIIAAAGIVALNKMVDRLADDHKNAHTLATSLATIPGITLDLSTVQTNIVYINLDAATIKVTAVEIRDILKSKYGILITAMDARRIRFVTHWQITSQHIQQVLTHLKTIIQA